jgi:hypothetical protein
MKQRRCINAGPRYPYRIRTRGNVFEVVRINLHDPINMTLAECIAMAPTLSTHASEQDAERAIGGRMRRGDVA